MPAKIIYILDWKFDISRSIHVPVLRVDVDLTYGRLTSELISLSVGSELTFYAVLDSFSARGHGKNCPVKIFEVYVEILGVLYFG